MDDGDDGIVLDIDDGDEALQAIEALPTWSQVMERLSVTAFDDVDRHAVANGALNDRLVLWPASASQLAGDFHLVPLDAAATAHGALQSPMRAAAGALAALGARACDGRPVVVVARAAPRASADDVQAALNAVRGWMEALEASRGSLDALGRVVVAADGQTDAGLHAAAKAYFPRVDVAPSPLSKSSLY